MDFGFSVGFFYCSVEEELDLFIQRPMLLFSASGAIRGIPLAPRTSHRIMPVPVSPAFALMTFTMFTTFTVSVA
jgi:hypothetical protein